MARHALFDGLVIDEQDNIVSIKMIGDEAYYVVDDAGFMRHIASEDVDRQVMGQMGEMMEGMEGNISEQAAKMLGQDDIFTKAMIENQLKNMDDQIDKMLEVGIPEGSRAFLGMAGFRIRINLHGDVIEIQQPSGIDPEED